MNKYSNPSRHIHREENPLEKVASIYDKQAISNRVVEEKPLSFSSLSPSEASAVVNLMKKEAEVLDGLELDKKADTHSSPFDRFALARHTVISQLGISGDAADDLASSVLVKAEEIQNGHGGELDNIISGIVEHMDSSEIKRRTGAMPMRHVSRKKTEEKMRLRLINEMGLSAHQADQMKKVVSQQARDLSTLHRQYSFAELCDAIINVIVEHDDTSIAYGMASNERLRDEIKYQLNDE